MSESQLEAMFRTLYVALGVGLWWIWKLENRK